MHDIGLALKLLDVSNNFDGSCKVTETNPIWAAYLLDV